MGTGKKEASRRERQGDAQSSTKNLKVKGENFYRTAKKAKALNILKEGKPQRNAAGHITKAASYQSRELPQARVEPNRKWFGNTRVISQDALSSFRAAMAERAADPYTVLLKSNKLPLSLIRDAPNVGENGLKQHRAKMAVDSEPFGEVFGPRAQRKRVKLSVGTMGDLVGEAEKRRGDYAERMENARTADAGQNTQPGGEPDAEQAGTLATAREPIFNKGQSKRIWNELYKVIDSSDVVIHVLDARDPLGTRCRGVEKHIKEEAPHKHLIFVLNKCDLVPTGVAASWVRALSKEYPTLAFHASITNSFGKGSLIQLLRQFSQLHAHRKQICVGFIGYPNTGKSSIINTLRKKKVCTVAPIPGETKVWQYITLMKRIYLIDCPGVVPPNPNDAEQDILLRGVVRVENVEAPEQYMDALLAKTKPRHVERTYGVQGWKSPNEFLEMLARKGGRLLKGGEADLAAVAKMVINDFMRGKLPWFTPPPVPPGQEGAEAETGIEGRAGRLGEMGKKRKREEFDASIADDSAVPDGSSRDDDLVVLDGEDVDQGEAGGDSSGQDESESDLDQGIHIDETLTDASSSEEASNSGAPPR